MSSNRIWLDLAAFFSGVQQQSCIIVDHDKFKTVKDVENHVRRVFEIDSPFFILNDGWLLPSSESSLLLRDNDTVSVVPQTEAKAPLNMDQLAMHSATKASMLSSNESENVESLKPSSREEEKENGQSSDCEISVASLKNPFAQPMSKVTLPIETNLEHSKNAEALNGHSSAAAAATQDDGQDPDLSSNHVSEIGTQKRRRTRRKRKPALETDEQLKPREVKQSRYVTNKLLQGVSHILNTSLASEKTNKKHIFFQEDGELRIEVKSEKPAAQVGKEEVSAPRCWTTPVVETGLSKLISLSNQKSPLVFERKKLENANKTISITPRSMKLTPLKEIPVKETIIKFKVLKMVNYCPTVSEVITARVISPDFSSHQLYVQITDGLDELQTEKGKFSLDQDEDDDSAVAPSPYQFLDWQNLIDPMAVEC